jgi:uncharacterized protein (TIGR02246 family)
MRFVRIVRVAAAALSLSLPAVAAAVQTPAAADEAAIVQLGKTWENAWNSRDAHALASLLAEDADFVTVLGPNGWLKGRARFESVHAGMFPRLFSKSVWTTKEVQVRFLRPDIAIAHVLWATTGDEVRHVKHGSPREGIFTWVVERQKGAVIDPGLAKHGGHANPARPVARRETPQSRDVGSRSELVSSWLLAKNLKARSSAGVGDS